jgi:hypothetical protein
MVNFISAGALLHTGRIESNFSPTSCATYKHFAMKANSKRMASMLGCAGHAKDI